MTPARGSATPRAAPHRAPPGPRRRALLALLALTILGILRLTLTPAADASTEALRLTCIVCGQQGGADAVLNVLLFAPVALLLGALGVPGRRALLATALLSLGIETAQAFVPGRDPALGDLLFNSLGGVLGWSLARSPAAWLLPPAHQAARRSLAAAAAVVAGTAGAGYLLGPARSDPPFGAEWTERTTTLAWYPGRVLGARIGDLELPPGRLPDPLGFRRRLLHGEPLELRATTGPPVPALAPLLGIYADGGEALLLGVAGNDLVFRYRPRAHRLRLVRPEFGLPGALAGIPAGRPLLVRVRIRPSGVDLAAGPGARARIGFTVGSGWMLFLASQFGRAPFPWYLPPLWLAALCAPVGLWLRPRPASAAALLLLAAGLPLAGLAVGLAPAPPLETAGAGLGLLAGAGLHALLRRARVPRAVH
ncbi:MAG TPA: VanZ family protein [Longimicrobiales bacterium]|nr:VanZ family protein [Longimicrobiales bacterium]